MEKVTVLQLLPYKYSDVSCSTCCPGINKNSKDAEDILVQRLSDNRQGYNHVTRTYFAKAGMRNYIHSFVFPEPIIQSSPSSTANFTDCPFSILRHREVVEPSTARKSCHL